MITRMWEAVAVAGRAADLAAWASEALLPGGTDGFLGGRAYVSHDGGDRVVVIGDWRDEAALAAFHGTSWRTAAGTGGAGADLLAREPHVWHFTPVSTGQETIHN